MPLVPFAPWRPDVAHLNSSFASDVANVLLAYDSYIPFPELVPYSNAVSEQPIGGITVRDSAGSVHIFVGTATHLRKFNSSTRDWDDVSKAATTYSASVDERWRFKQFGNYVIAVNVNDAPQVYELGVSSTFDDLAGSPPNARHISIWGDQLALMNGPTVTWSDTDDITNWSTGNSGSQTFPDGGNIQGATDSTNPIIFQQRAIRAGTFVPGSSIVFTFQKIHDKRGAAAPYSICSRGEFAFFADSGAFYQIAPSGEIAPIGYEKVDRTIFGQIAGGNLASIYGEIDPFFTRVYFAVRVDSTNNAFDKLLIYDWNKGEWSQIDTEMDILLPLSSGTIGYTLEGLDDISASLDDLEFSLDSKVWQGGAPVMAAFDTDNKLGFFSGDNAEAILVTQELGDPGGQVMLVKEMYPVIDTNDVYVSVGCRFRRGDNVVWTGEGVPSANTGIVRKRCRSRFHRFKLRVPAGVVWSHAQGVNVKPQPMGMR